MSPGQSQSKLLQRQKQIDYGKNTVGYEKYLQLVPKSKRGPTDPKTPNIYVSNSKRAFDGMVKKWRRELHRYDRENIRNFQVSSSFDDYAVVYSAETSCILKKYHITPVRKHSEFHVKKVGKVLKVLKCSYCRTSPRATLFFWCKLLNSQRGTCSLLYTLM